MAPRPLRSGEGCALTWRETQGQPEGRPDQLSQFELQHNARIAHSWRHNAPTTLEPVLMVDWLAWTPTPDPDP